MNAIEAALAMLHNAINALERHSKPTPKDVESAHGHAKNATDILKASNALLDEGIFTVAEEPELGTPLPFEQTETSGPKRHGRQKAAGE